jgi:hypothetical protein
MEKRLDICYWNDELARMPAYASKNFMPIYASNLMIFKVQELNYSPYAVFVFVAESDRQYSVG